MSVPFDLLSQLWLHEPDADMLAAVRAIDAQGLHEPHLAQPDELAVAYADLFLLNVFPYGTAFTDPFGELNGRAALHVAAQYEACDYAPQELTAVGAPDHLGLCLGFLAHLEQRGKLDATANFLSHFITWAPVCCFAVEREPTAHSFYRSIATLTREALLTKFSEQPDKLKPPAMEPHQLAIAESPSEDEVRLRDIVRFLMAAARCGIFLSRSRLGLWTQSLGSRQPFAARFNVAESMFETAGELGKVDVLLGMLAAEATLWQKAYQAWGLQHPAWQAFALPWLERIEATNQLLNRMQENLDHRVAATGGL